MRIQTRPGVAALFCGMALGVCVAQQPPRQSASPAKASVSHRGKTDRALTPDDGLSVIAAALDSRVHLRSEPDCSHLVHAIYERAGFPYTYASSDDLYDGVEGFRRITYPQPGDLIVWHGHAGIVVRPSRHVFFSFMSKGPGVDDYRAAYWIGRGEPRFYRYVKNDPCPGCTRASTSIRPIHEDK